MSWPAPTTGIPWSWSPEPEPYGAWWRIRGEHAHRLWYTDFGANTPVEILASLTDALLAPDPDTMPDIWPTLTAAGWSYERDERGNESATHPDGILSLRRWTVSSGDHFYWTAEATLPNEGGGRERIWRASLDDRMPRHLLAAFATALASDEPVQRGRNDVPHSHLVTQEQRGPQGEQLAAAHEQRLKTVRAAARKARRSAPPTTRTVPPPTAAPNHALQGR